MPSPRRILASILLLAMAAAVPARAAETVYAGVSLLDEYNIDVMGAGDSARMAAGLSFGTAYPTGWWWTAGPRLSWVRWNVDMPRQDGIGAGGMFGMGYRPERTVSPFAAVALDRVFNVSSRFDWQSVIYAGARVKVTTDPREYFSMTFALYQSAVFGGNGPSGSDYGIAVLYSAALFAKKR
ncbi:MAG TPA: hypothetical protein VFV19_01270 [Candidatus Polarisedimenticolaceae bacterium]|nr:hypothetical protein [Candidatus Polarisedimenticolaceae bacterium]